MQVKKKDFAPGDFRPPRVQVSPDSLPQGAVAERKTQDRALLSQFSEEHLAEAFHGLPVSIVILRLSDRRIVYANDSFLQLSRFTQEEVIGRSEADLQTWVNLEDRERRSRP